MPAATTPTHSASAVAIAALCCGPSRYPVHPGTTDATASAAPPRASQYGQPSDAAGASRTRSGSKARRLRSGPVATPRKTRIAAAMDEIANVAAARAGAAASTHATPNTARVVVEISYECRTRAAPTAATPDPASAITRRGSLPTRARRGAAIAATPHAYTRSRSVAVVVAATIGMSRYRTTMATTDHTDCAIALAAGAAVDAVRVNQGCSGHRARSEE